MDSPEPQDPMGITGMGGWRGEGGEYETLVVKGPHMQRRLTVEGTVQWDGVRGHYDVH